MESQLTVADRNAKGVAEVITLSRSFVSTTAKAKTAKLSKLWCLLNSWHNTDEYIVRTVLDCFNNIPGSQQIQIDVLRENIEWAQKEKRIFLKHSLETRLVGL